MSKTKIEWAERVMTHEEIRSLLASINGTTPGPWRWTINRDSKIVRLGSHRWDVMDFVRYGIKSAAPQFMREKLLSRADEFAIPFPGEERHAKWCATIDHPDARLIEAAPLLLDAVRTLLAEVEELKAGGITP